LDIHGVKSQRMDGNTMLKQRGLKKRGRIWWIQISVGGKTYRESTRTEVKKEAEEYYDIARERLWREHKLGDKSCILWSVVVREYLAHSDKERKRERAILAWFATYLDDEPIRVINAKLIEKLRGYLADENMARSTINRFMDTLKAVLNKAVELEYIPSAPKVPRFDVKPFEPHWLSPEQFAELRKHLPEHLKLAADVAAFTGLRMRSMTKLTWDRVQLDRAWLWVPGSQMKGGQAHGIPLTPPVIEAFKALRVLNPTGNDVFQWNGKRLDDCNGKAFKDAVRAAGLEPLRWHDLRHCFASWARQAGISSDDLMDLGGWKSPAMVRRYAHFSPVHLATAAQKLCLFLAQSADKSSKTLEKAA
jgi:integrase